MNALQHVATSNLEVQQSQTARSKMLQGYQQNRSKTHDSAHKLQIIFFFQPFFIPPFFIQPTQYPPEDLFSFWVEFMLCR
jgi:hypothetical protein